MNRSYQLKAQDVVLLLKLLSSSRATFRMIDLAYELGISQSEVSQGLERLRTCQLVSSDKKRPLRGNALEFLAHGLRYVFPPEIGPATRGIPTAHSMPPLLNQLATSKDDNYVWPSPDGRSRGHAITPLYPSVPQAALRDKKLHELLALVDAIRVGRAREQKLAIKNLEERINAEGA